MNLRGTAGVTLCGLAVFAAGAAFATAAPSRSDTGQTSSTATSTTAGTPHGHAYGFYCRNQSKQHIPGQKGTPFSQCVTAMAKLGHGTTDSPAKACASMSKKHVKGQKGTPFSECVSAAAKLLGNEH